jgi:hypothetical protein
MALGEPIILKNYADASRNYVRVADVSGTNPNGGTYSAQENVIGADESLIFVRPTYSVSKGKSSSRFNLHHGRKVTDSTGSSVLNVDITINRPTDARITTAMVYDSLRQAIGFFATADPTLDVTRIDQILRGEV